MYLPINKTSSASMSWILTEEETSINHVLGHVPGDYI